MTSKRIYAINILLDIFEKGMKVKDAMEQYFSLIDERDRSFIMEIVYGVLRRMFYLDWILNHFIKDMSLVSKSTLNNLRTAIYQIIHMRVPARAAVHEAVEIEKSYSGRVDFVNAVLRNYIRKADGIKTKSIDDLRERISIETSHPRWLIDRWVNRYGLQGAEALARYNNERPPIVVRVRNKEQFQKGLHTLKEQGFKTSISLYCPNCILIHDTIKFATLRTIFGDDFVLQDEASQLVSLLLNVSKGMKVLDACSAPGGKTSHLADMMEDTGIIYSVEGNTNRFGLLNETIQRLNLKSVRPINCYVEDIKKVLSKDGIDRFDRILLDAPCSGLGVIRRKPDVRYRHTENDLKRFMSKQVDMLTGLSDLLVPNGLMVYAVCSNEPEEGEQVITRFLQKKSGFSIINSNKDIFRSFRTASKHGFICYNTLPHLHSMDGFFMALIKRIA
ncbi:MAG: 16S rRNA (cytosine(967)-C(5))-methyltransferase RsmB [Thermodesulfovibrionales bacterium]|nr:16S rRNA (cytosine(967)-C(5))-methyltransferase RsmB [Thermodesulfovibrionales bacterium]